MIIETDTELILIDDAGQNIDFESFFLKIKLPKAN